MMKGKERVQQEASAHRLAGGESLVALDVLLAGGTKVPNTAVLGTQQQHSHWEDTEVLVTVCG
jgi:hypothetical protein